MLVLVLITIASLASTIVLANKLDTLKKATASTAAPTAEDIAKVVSQVGKSINLPEGETPTMATVADPSALKDQPFFAQAAAGDIVLIFEKSRKAILWRPSTEKIIEVSAINLPPPTDPTKEKPTPSVTPTPTPSPVTTKTEATASTSVKTSR